jgi:NADPH-dependent 2,4-dienoyl-CoA reductase/sulfur reductase-like enzyme
VGFGDCQGNQCTVPAIAAISAAAGLAPVAIEKGPVGSWLIAAEGEPVAPDDPIAAPIGGDEPSDVLVVGGGMAGIGAALALADAGRRVTVVDRRATPGGALRAIDRSAWTEAERDAVERARELVAAGRLGWIPAATVVALDHDGRTWSAEVAGEAGRTVVADHVILATGGYLMPREHSVVDGPRSSGVMTGDLVADALERGWRPARRALVVGAGRVAAATADRLRAGGVEAELVAGRADGTTDRAVTAVRGQPRLTAAEVDGRWLEADALVLVDRLLPATFLLRGLGLGDERPGVPAPVDERGALPMVGLWAAGTCVSPDVDHRASLAAGETVGAAVLAELLAATGAASVTR